jgi:hypothetical protein
MRRLRGDRTAPWLHAPDPRSRPGRQPVMGDPSGCLHPIRSRAEEAFESGRLSSATRGLSMAFQRERHAEDTRLGKRSPPSQPSARRVRSGHTNMPRIDCEIVRQVRNLSSRFPSFSRLLRAHGEVALVICPQVGVPSDRRWECQPMGRLLFPALRRLAAHNSCWI